MVAAVADTDGRLESPSTAVDRSWNVVDCYYSAVVAVEVQFGSLDRVCGFYR